MMYDYCNTKFPDLADFWALYVVLYARKLFSQIYNQNHYDIIKKELISEFNRYYKKVRYGDAIKTLSFKSRIALKIFTFSPKLYAALYNDFH